MSGADKKKNKEKSNRGAEGCGPAVNCWSSIF